jgi:type II secretory pathway component PulK
MGRTAMPPAPRDERGFILIAVLWLLVAIAAVGLDAGLRGRSERLAVANSVDDARARAAAYAGAEYARSRLTAAMLARADELRAQVAQQRGNARGGGGNARGGGGNARTLSVERLFRSVDPMEDPWRDPSGLVMDQIALVDSNFRLQVRDTGAAVNLNEADEEMLRNFFAQGIGLDFTDADRITQAVLDWRDEDELPRVGGGEREEYLDEGLPVLPPNRPFASLDELRFVLGMTPQAFEAAAPHLTLIGNGRINVNAAPEAVLLAVPGMTPAIAGQIIRNRESGVFPRDTDEFVEMVPGAVTGSGRRAERELLERIAFATNEVEILSEGWIEGSPVTATVHLVVSRANEGALVVWRRIE